MRPSEAIALRCGDIELRREVISVTKSRYLDTENSPKTSHSEREVRLLPTVAELLAVVKPLHVTDEDYAFKNQDGESISSFTPGEPRPGIECYGPRESARDRHTYISAVLSLGVNIKWLAEQCGTSVAMIEKHYGKYTRTIPRSN